MREPSARFWLWILVGCAGAEPPTASPLEDVREPAPEVSVASDDEPATEPAAEAPAAEAPAAEEPAAEEPEPAIPSVSLRPGEPAWRWDAARHGIPTSAEEWASVTGAFEFRFPDAANHGTGRYARWVGRWRSRGTQLEVNSSGQYVWIELVTGGFREYSPDPVVCAYTGELRGNPDAPYFWGPSLREVTEHEETYRDYRYCSVRGLGPFRPFGHGPTTFFATSDAFTWVYAVPFPLLDGEDPARALGERRSMRTLRFVRVGADAPARPPTGHWLRGEWLWSEGDRWGTLAVDAGDTESANYELRLGRRVERGSVRCTRSTVFPSSHRCSGTLVFTPTRGRPRTYAVSPDQTTRLALRRMEGERRREAALLIATRSL
ncbi:MAG: hypothetical protein AAGE52_00955 [Myxococcota bacterium]